MKTLYESILDADFDVREEDLDTIDRFLKQFGYNGRIKSAADPDRFCSILSSFGKEIPNASIYDAKAALLSGNGFLIVSSYRRLRQVRAIFLMWPKSGDEFYFFDSYPKTNKWADSKIGDVDWLINLRCGLDFQKDDGIGYPPKDCNYFELKPEEYKKFLKILGKGKAPE